MTGLDPHARPPEHLRTMYKKYQRIDAPLLAQDCHVIDLSRSDHQGVRPIHHVDTAGLAQALDLPDGWPGHDRTVQAYEIEALPGLHVVPGLLDIVCQRELLWRLLHRDLADKRHATNVGLHYRVPYEICTTGREPASQLSQPEQEADEESNSAAPKCASFFSCPPTSNHLLEPLDAKVHKALTIDQFLNKKLRWITLGGQYDWTRKVYPTGRHPDFPSDIAAAVSALFPEMRPEAAITNLYSPGDTLSLHRDVSEEIDAGLASLSIGCDALFIVGLESGDRPESAGVSESSPSATVIRLRSGDAIYMSGPARFAWHGVPQVLRDTCPEQLASWPANCPRKEGRYEGSFAGWQGWLAQKRVNLNVRQMRA